MPKLSLTKVGLIMVSLPIIFELGFITALGFQVSIVQRERRQELHERKVISLSTAMITSVYESMRDIVTSRRRAGKSRAETFRQHAGDIAARRRELKELVADHPEEREAYDKVLRETEQGMKDLDVLVDVSRDYDTAQRAGMRVYGSARFMEGMLAYYRAMKSMAVLQRGMEEFIVSIRDKGETVSAEKVQKAQITLVMLYLGGIVGNIALTLAVARYFIGDLVSRIRVMEENSIRVVKGLALRPAPVAINDELDQLDVAIHSMARSIEDSEQLKRKYLALIGKAMRDPLNGILQRSREFVQKEFGVVSEKAEGYFAKISQHIQRLVLLLDDITYLDTSEFSLEKSQCAIGPIVTESIGCVEELSKQKNLRVVFDGSDLLVTVDPRRIVQILINLLSNAIKFSPNGSAIEVSINDAGEDVQIKVRDHGRGIPADYLQDIFEKYKQVREEDGRSRTGTGLGLPICKKIVDQHGGSISVSSKIGEGSEFVVSLPKQERAGRVDPVAENQDSPSRFTLKSRLLQKSLIICGVPLGFELLLVSVLGCLLILSMNEKSVETQQRRVEATAGQVTNELYGICRLVTGLNTMTNFSRRAQAVQLAIPKLRQDVSQVEQTLTTLSGLTSSNPQQSAIFQKTMQDSQGLLADLHALPDAMDDGDKRGRDMFGVIGRLIGNDEKFFGGLKQLTTDAHQLNTESMQRTQALDDLFNGILVVGFLGTVVVGIGVALFFMKDLVRRITALQENTRRVAEGVELLPERAECEDEIDYLDRTIHTMDQSIKNARRMKEDFTAMVSHDLRSPLSAVLAALSLTKEGVCGELPAKAQEVVAGMCVSVDELVSLVSDLLDIEKIENGKLRIAPKLFGLQEAIRDCVERVQPLCASHCVELHVESHNGVAQGDPERVSQVLANLLSFAIRNACPDSRVDFSVRLSLRDVKFTVAFKSVSIDEEYQPIAFDRFRAVQHSERVKCGLSLPISKKLAELHTGVLELVRTGESDWRFELLLPQNDIEDDSLAEESPSLSEIAPNLI